MPFDGSGNFNRVMNWVNDAAAAIKIRADRHDAEDDNLAQGLSNTLTKDGQSQPTANIPMNGKRLVNLANPVNPQDATTKASVEALVDSSIHAAPEKVVPVAADDFAIADSATTPTPWKRARITWANLSAAIWNGFTVASHALAAKTTLVDLDEFTIGDSVATPTAWAPKRHSWANLQAMIGIGPSQRLAKLQATPIADCNLATESGWYHTLDGTTINAPVAGLHGFLEVFSNSNSAANAQAQTQIWRQAFPSAGNRSFTRSRWFHATGVWDPWVETTSVNALLKDKDGVITGAGYSQVAQVTPDAPSSGNYTPSPNSGNLRQVNAPGTAWNFNAPTTPNNNFSMVVLIFNPAIAVAPTFVGFNKVSGGTHPTALGKASLAYITKIGAIKTLFLEPLP